MSAIRAGSYRWPTRRLLVENEITLATELESLEAEVNAIAPREDPDDHELGC